MNEENQEETSVRLVGTGIWIRDLPNASLVRYHGASSLGSYLLLLVDLLLIADFSGCCPIRVAESLSFNNSFNNVTRQIAREDILNNQRRESFESYKIFLCSVYTSLWDVRLTWIHFKLILPRYSVANSVTMKDST